jgi:uncharacterized membrane protein YdjX (TVP38/TMEM64 family)
LNRNKTLLLMFGCAVALSIYFFRIPIWDEMVAGYRFFSDREKIRTFIEVFGFGAPVIFIAIQILQVLLAPVPGEATGFIGGYLFGIPLGFLYSSIGLTAGSWLNFSVGRLLGKRLVRKMIPENTFNRFDTLLRRQGVIVVFILFVIPGFPKDLLCLFLGLSTLPIKLLILLAAVGRMPGTLMLSIQGAFVYKQMYGWFVALMVLCAVVAFIGYRFREELYQWVDRLNTQSH